MVFLPGPHNCLEIYFLRHGIASPRGNPEYPDDSLRPLTSQGREKMRREAQGMRNLALTFDAVLSSPYLRARQTAEIVAETYGMKKNSVHLTRKLLPPSCAEGLLQEACSSFPKAGNLLFVGHEPHLTSMVSELLKCRQSLDIDFKKGGLCCLSFKRAINGNGIIFNWLLTPAQLVLLGRD